jgi:hypothetical protein
MMLFTNIASATLDALTDELAAACWDSTQTSVIDARDAVARLLNTYGDLRLYDSETGELITSSVTDDQAAESAQSVEGHILVDGRKCYVAE